MGDEGFEDGAVVAIAAVDVVEDLQAREIGFAEGGEFTGGAAQDGGGFGFGVAAGAGRAGGVTFAVVGVKPDHAVRAAFLGDDEVFGGWDWIDLNDRIDGVGGLSFQGMLV